MVRLEPEVHVAHGDLDRWHEVYDGPHDEHGMPHEDCVYCGTESPWWAPVLPQHAFLRDGLIHLTNPWDNRTSLCGSEAVPYGIEFHSTDAALAHAHMLGSLRLEVSCLFCIASDIEFPHGHAVAW